MRRPCPTPHRAPERHAQVRATAELEAHNGLANSAPVRKRRPRIARLDGNLADAAKHRVSGHRAIAGEAASGGKSVEKALHRAMRQGARRRLPRHRCGYRHRVHECPIAAAKKNLRVSCMHKKKRGKPPGVHLSLFFGAFALGVGRWALSVGRWALASLGRVAAGDRRARRR